MKLLGFDVQSKIEDYVQLEWIQEDEQNKVVVYPKTYNKENSNKLILEENKEYIFITDRNGAFTDKIKEIDYDNELIKFYSFPYTINPQIDVWGIGIL